MLIRTFNSLINLGSAFSHKKRLYSIHPHGHGDGGWQVHSCLFYSSSPAPSAHDASITACPRHLYL